jgi:hypothetical protein
MTRNSAGGQVLCKFRSSLMHADPCVPGRVLGFCRVGLLSDRHTKGHKGVTNAMADLCDGCILYVVPWCPRLTQSSYCWARGIYGVRVDGSIGVTYGAKALARWAMQRQGPKRLRRAFGNFSYLARPAVHSAAAPTSLGLPSCPSLKFLLPPQFVL